jgi:predicted MPP superfamily phosphohydrolase
VRQDRPSDFIVKSFGPAAEWLIDKIFLSSVVVAPAAVLGALVCLVNGWPLLALAALVVAGVATVGIYARFIAPFRLAVRHLTLHDLGLDPIQHSRRSARGTKPIRIVFFSDLHVGEFKRQNWADRVVDLVNAQSPDLVLIGGDFVGRTRCCVLAELLSPLRRLQAPLGAYGVLGNHDHGIPGRDHSEELTALLPQLGVRLLRNECVHVGGLQLIGVAEIWTERDDLHGALGQCSDPDARTLVLGHNPDLMLRIDAEHPALRAERTLFLFGHTHQGQIYIPFLPGLGVPIKSTFYRGIYRTPYGALYVSSGCGENTTPTRLNTRPEIVVVDL